MENLFERAVKKDTFYLFLIGEGDFFVLDREHGGHWYYGSYIENIEPFIMLHGEERFIKLFFPSCEKVLNNSPDLNMTLNAIVSYLIPYYYNKDDERVKYRNDNTPITFINKLKDTFSSNRISLEKDNRLVGAEWCTAVNKGLGLWGGIMANLEVIKARGGPNLH